ncbi:MAG: hypothetical protein M3N42_16170 [Cyanobacteriota bacterium]|nr:hypothetical protein [Cyanobacteriota bacterium]
MRKMKVTQADGSSEIVEDETFRKTPIIPKFNQYQPRAKTLEVILKSLEVTNGQTVEQLAVNTNIPAYFLPKYLLDLEKEKQIGKSGPRHYLIENPPSPETVT